MMKYIFILLIMGSCVTYHGMRTEVPSNYLMPPTVVDTTELLTGRKKIPKSPRRIDYWAGPTIIETNVTYRRNRAYWQDIYGWTRKLKKNDSKRISNLKN